MDEDDEEISREDAAADDGDRIRKQEIEESLIDGMVHKNS